jgi:hypothetical protein
MYNSMGRTIPSLEGSVACYIGGKSLHRGLVQIGYVSNCVLHHIGYMSLYMSNRGIICNIMHIMRVIN